MAIRIDYREAETRHRLASEGIPGSIGGGRAAIAQAALRIE